ncbi:hypothetical protein [Brevibacillus laterosporus]|uniref:hypothetical protein n=1 Tax=Brevibacillus laterosporus TaxID=1465 RepID=UPI003D19D1C9
MKIVNYGDKITPTSYLSGGKGEKVMVKGTELLYYESTSKEFLTKGITYIYEMPDSKQKHNFTDKRG